MRVWDELGDGWLCLMTCHCFMASDGISLSKSDTSNNCICLLPLVQLLSCVLFLYQEHGAGVWRVPPFGDPVLSYPFSSVRRGYEPVPSYTQSGLVVTLKMCTAGLLVSLPWSGLLFPTDEDIID